MTIHMPSLAMDPSPRHQLLSQEMSKLTVNTPIETLVISTLFAERLVSSNREDMAVNIFFMDYNLMIG